MFNKAYERAMLEDRIASSGPSPLRLAIQAIDLDEESYYQATAKIMGAFMSTIDKLMEIKPHETGKHLHWELKESLEKLRKVAKTASLMNIVTVTRLAELIDGARNIILPDWRPIRTSREERYASEIFLPQIQPSSMEIHDRHADQDDGSDSLVHRSITEVGSQATDTSFRPLTHMAISEAGAHTAERRSPGSDAPTTASQVSTLRLGGELEAGPSA
jgi:hypothetical protein